MIAAVIATNILVALAIDGQADYLVTLDMRHLGRLKKVGKAKILTPAKFLAVLKDSSNEVNDGIDS